jgi:membrane protein DedA with SNARE-associated domain
MKEGEEEESSRLHETFLKSQVCASIFWFFLFCFLAFLGGEQWTQD